MGGNGHSGARLRPARAALERFVAAGELESFVIDEVPYPGFENRAKAMDWPSFLGSVAAYVDRQPEPKTIYGAGIGGLIALSLRAQRIASDVPILLQGAVLWGLERRWMPRLFRLGLARFALRKLLAVPFLQRRFVRKYFEAEPSADLQRAFFEGYNQCTASADFFNWMDSRLLRKLERAFTDAPELLERIQVWWGGQDHVVSLQELKWTEEALGRQWPTRVFPHWGHYPMIDEPDEWVKELHHVLAAAEPV